MKKAISLAAAVLLALPGGLLADFNRAGEQAVFRQELSIPDVQRQLPGLQVLNSSMAGWGYAAAGGSGNSTGCRIASYGQGNLVQNTAASGVLSRPADCFSLALQNLDTAGRLFVFELPQPDWQIRVIGHYSLTSYDFLPGRPGARHGFSAVAAAEYLAARGVSWHRPESKAGSEKSDKGKKAAHGYGRLEILRC